MFTFVLHVLTLFSRMEHSSVQVATALHPTSVVMVTGTAGIWVMRCTVPLASLVVVIVLRASLNVAIICVWTREICVMGRTTVVTTRTRAPVFAVSASRIVNAGSRYWYRPSCSRPPDNICHILIRILLSSPGHDSQFCLHRTCFIQVAFIFYRSLMFVTDYRNTFAHFIWVSYFMCLLMLKIFIVNPHIWEYRRLQTEKSVAI